MLWGRTYDGSTDVHEYAYAYEYVNGNWIGWVSYGTEVMAVFSLVHPLKENRHMMVLDHEKLDVYQVVRALSKEIGRLMKKIRPGRPDLVLQVLRAIASIPLNIAEGSGERAPGRRAYFFRIARASATEVSAGLDHMVDMGLLKNEDILASKAFLVRIVSMLVKMTDKVTSPDSFAPPPPPAKTRS
jgi:four helix bundle protein